jgi:hypothetical protein
MELFRAMVEIRYLAPLYLDVRGQIVDKFTSHYKLIGYDLAPNPLHETVKLRDPQREFEVFANAMHCGGEMRFDPIDLETFAHDVSVFCSGTIREVLKVKDLKRIGTRYFYREKTPSDEVMSMLLKKALHPLDDFSDVRFVGGNWRVRLETEDDEHKYTFQYYPERITEGGEERPTGHLVLDIDVAQMTPPLSALAALEHTITSAQRSARIMGKRILERIANE